MEEETKSPSIPSKPVQDESSNVSHQISNEFIDGKYRIIDRFGGNQQPLRKMVYLVEIAD
jgi:hypothetical protein